MKRFLLIFPFVLISINIFSQTECNIKKNYNQIFKITKQQYEDKEYLIKTVNKIDSNSCFAALVNNNKYYLDYLLTNFSSRENYEKLNAIKDSVELQNEFIKQLQCDSLFNSTMNNLTNKITNKTSYQPDTLTMDELLNVAVKFFSIIRINDEGYYSAKVCTGINGIRETEKKRKPQVEAFCFTTIFNHYQSEDYNMYNELVKGVKEVYKLNLGIDDDQRLLRAQGAMYMAMRNNEVLHELLQVEYENKKEYLPFVLKKE